MCSVDDYGHGHDTASPSALDSGLDDGEDLPDLFEV